MTRVIKHVRHTRTESPTSANQNHEPSAQVSDRALDEAIEESFPASDPPSIGGVTRVESGSGATAGQVPRDKPDQGSHSRSPGSSYPQREEKRS